MNEQEEQPRPSLRLRKIPDRPPAAPPEPPKASEPAPPSEQKDDAGAAPRLRLSSIIKPASGDSPPVAPSTPPEPPAPPPAPAVPPPKSVEQTPEPSPAPAPPPPVPTPRPVVAAAPPPPTPTPPPPPTPDPGLPVVEAPRPLHFPSPPEQEAPAQEPEPKPPSPRTVGLVILVALVLVVGGVAYLLFADPLGLFKHAKPAPSAPAVVSSPPPRAPPAAATATPPATTAPAVATAATTTAPAAATATPKEELPEFKMPPPAPLAAPVSGEEIAPGVVRLPRDAAGVSSSPSTAPVPAPRTYEPPPPKQNPAYIALVNNLNITGIRANSSGGYLMIGTAMYRPGDIVDNQTKLEFVSIDGAMITFKDPAGVTYTRRF